MRTATNQGFNEKRLQYFSSAVGCLSTKFIESGKGAILRDVEGREYIDFAGGIGAMNVGHSHPKVVSAIKNQAEKMTHTCLMINPYPPAVELAEKLCTITPGSFPKKVVLVSSGAEAVENAVKIARYKTKRPGIIVFENAYHGRTLLTMSMTSKVKPYKLGFGPFAPEVYRMPFGDVLGAEGLADFFIKHINPEAVAAVVAEPIQGEGGFITPPENYFQELTKICRENGIIFIADEIQTGIGRTGKMFAIEHWNVEPDLIVVGKSLAAGMPLAGVVGKADIMDSIHPWGLGGTYGGNPVACAAANAVLDIIESEHLIEKARKLGTNLRSHLERFKEKFDFIGEIRGIGAMLGFEIIKKSTKAPAADETKHLVNYCHENGLIILSCGTYGNIIRFLLPFVITDSELEKGFSILENGLKTI